ncbi:unnamed protein product [Heterobilharzia americana]|nr:unnamed protein product [Heterobilharzia americana]
MLSLMFLQLSIVLFSSVVAEFTEYLFGSLSCLRISGDNECVDNIQLVLWLFSIEYNFSLSFNECCKCSGSLVCLLVIELQLLLFNDLSSFE